MIWAARNGCEPTPHVESIAADVDRFQFPCPAGAEVVLYRINGGGHTWPGSEFSKSIESIVGPTTSSISANDIIWHFFMDHPMQSR
jgi:polyhydroxybutyrate depolymerase